MVEPKIYLKSIVVINDSSSAKTPEQKAKYDKAVTIVQNENRPLVSKNISSGTIYFQVTNPELKDFSNSMVQQLQKINYRATGTEYVNVKLKNNEIRYFNEVDLISANQLQTDLKGYGLETSIKKTITNRSVPIGQLEVWIAKK